MNDTKNDATSPARHALVTGGSRGIGRAVVQALLGDGWTVDFCSRSEESVNEALEHFHQQLEDPERVEGRPVDVGEQDEVDAWVDDVAGRRGGLHLVVNNAGVGRFHPVDEMSGDAWREQIRTNLDGPFYVTRAAAPHLRDADGGVIVNVASLAARHPFAGGAGYNASKFGLLGLSDASMLDLRKYDVRVVAILPGSVDTEFHASAHPEDRDDGDDSKNEWMLRPDDVARAVLDVLSYPVRALPSRIELRPTRTSSS